MCMKIKNENERWEKIKIKEEIKDQKWPSRTSDVKGIGFKGYFKGII